jgi:hypothetical protein
MVLTQMADSYQEQAENAVTATARHAAENAADSLRTAELACSAADRHLARQVNDDYAAA